MEINGRSSGWGVEGGDWRGMVLGVGRALDRGRLPSMKSCHHAFRWWPCWFYTWLAVSASLRCWNTASARWDVACAAIGGRQRACSPSRWCNARINHDVCGTLHLRKEGLSAKKIDIRKDIWGTFIHLQCPSLKAKLWNILGLWSNLLMMIHVRNRAGKCFNVPYNNICFKCDVKGEVCNIRAARRVRKINK